MLEGLLFLRGGCGILPSKPLPSFNDIFKVFILWAWVFCVHHTHDWGPSEVRRRHQMTLELVLWMVVDYCVGAGKQSQVLHRVVSAINYWVSSPTPTVSVLKSGQLWMPIEDPLDTGLINIPSTLRQFTSPAPLWAYKQWNRGRVDGTILLRSYLLVTQTPNITLERNSLAKFRWNNFFGLLFGPHLGWINICPCFPRKSHGTVCFISVR